MKSYTQIKQEREEAALRYQQEKAMKEATGGVGKVSKLNVLPDIVWAIRPVQELEMSLDIYHHTYNGDEKCNDPCWEHYNEKCPFCGSKSTKYGERYATPTKFLLAHVYNLVGKNWEFEDKVTKEKKTGPWNPLKAFAIPIGKKEAYIKPFLAASKRGEFTNTIFKIQRVTGTGWEVPEEMTEAELRELVGPNVPLALPTEYAKYKQMDKRSAWKLLLTCMPSARVEELLGPEPKVAAKSGVIIQPENSGIQAETDIPEDFDPFS